MNISFIPSAFDCLRRGQAVADAVKHRNAADLGKFLGLLIVALVQLVQGTSYAQYVSFVTPEMATSFGLFVAGACVAWGRWATTPDNGILPAKPVDGASVARSPGDAPAREQGPLAAPPGSQPADPSAPDPLRAGPAAVSGPTGIYMP
jgi:hypothetical protein